MATDSIALLGVRLDPAEPETPTMMPRPPAVWVEWEETVVPKGGPRQGKPMRVCHGVSIPLVIFKAAHAALGE